MLCSGCTSSKTVSIATSSLPEGKEGVPYSQTLAAKGGTPPYEWFISDGTLPPGMQLAPLTGIISGTPMIAHDPSFFTFQVDDHAGGGASKQLLFTVNPN
jgi:hypothetical protein